jgi:hypothetical protein
MEPAVRARFSSSTDPLRSLQHRHADDRRGVGGGDGDARSKAKVGVRRPEDHRHDDAEEDRPIGELGHLHARGRKGL